jgi:hypothetical protein
MGTSYESLDIQTAKQIKLIMTDVDGTLLASGREASPEVERALCLLQEQGIVLGLVSGRTMRELERMADKLGMKGPIIAENGGIAKLRSGEKLLELGYSRRSAEETFQKLQCTFPGKVTGREDNTERMIDIVIRTDGILPGEIRQHIGTTQLLDSGYIMHLMQEGISKGNTLQKLIDETLPYKFKKDEIMVTGDSATDVSLFELFPNSVLIRNPHLPEGQDEIVKEKASYISEKEYGDGFIEVALHIIQMRNGKGKN